MLRYRTNARWLFTETPGARPGGRADEGYVLASAAQRRYRGQHVLHPRCV